MVDEFNFEDPYRGRHLSLRVVPTEQLETIEHQRKARPAHVKNLVESMRRIGFIAPVVAVEQESDGDTRYVVIDGQHRLEAARTLDVAQLPVIVVPAELAQRMMSFNVEKDLNIRERASVSLGIYRTFMQSGPELRESDPEVVDSIERAYYVTLGIAYDKGSRLSGSAFEPLLKKCDLFLDVGVWDCYPTREKRASAVLEANDLVGQVTNEAKDSGIWHQYFQYQLLAYVDPYKRKKGPHDFDDFFGKVIAKLTELKDEPDQLGKVVRAG